MQSLAKRIVNNFAQKELQPMAYSEPTISTPLLAKSSSSSDSEGSLTPNQSPPKELQCCIPNTLTGGLQHKSLAILSGHIGSVSCLALCGEFILSASHGKDIIAWQQPDLRRFTKFGHGDGSVKALVTVGNRVFSAHQDGRIRVWKVSRSSENIFRLTATLPTTKDYLCKFMKQSNYVQTRRNHRKLWIEHADSISCLAVYGGVIYSGSWDKTLKVWRVADLRCLESIRAHDDAINGLVAHEGLVYSASADGKIKVWEKGRSMHCLKRVLEGRRDVSWNAVIICDEGRLVYGGGSDGRVMGWERDVGRDNWTLVCDVRTHEMAVLCLCSMGEFVCSGSADKSIGVWRRESGGGLWRVGIIRGPEGPVKCLQASCYSVGEGFMLYSGGLDKSLRVWWVPKEYSGARRVE
ncbi:protein JINGUBANG [Elaeis guineensis]|uniref:Protein JINGUBANG n=1 Tax=Elaeis guineensis var. tenera TaxID=51953 RepID=A0A6I9S7Z3_ELAGV|nr:protein JINGUBANG [Elaeis guineensis]